MNTQSRHAQRGAVLVVSLVLLVVLTLLGVSVMNISQLEERMASNSQELNQAFHSAETGLSRGYLDGDAWSLTATASQGLTVIDSELADSIKRSDMASYSTEFLSANVPLGGSDTTYRNYNFDIRSVGQSMSNFTTVIHGGGAQLGRDTGVDLGG